MGSFLWSMLGGGRRTVAVCVGRRSQSRIRRPGAAGKWESPYGITRAGARFITQSPVRMSETKMLPL